MLSSLMLLSSLGRESGNSSTANRIHQYLLNNNFACHVRDPKSFTSSSELRGYIKTHKITCLLGIHLYKAGVLLKDCSIPYIIIIGGTDVNKYHTDIKALDVMTHAADNARYLVVFGESLRKRIHYLWPNIGSETIVQIKQAVITKPSKFNLSSYLKSKELIDENRDLHEVKYFVWVGGIRTVKDPLYLVQVMSHWHQEDDNIYFILIGPKLEDEYYVEFLSSIKGLEGICYIPGLPSEDTHAAIKQACVYVNSSKSEGMSLAILEAMQLGTPVIGRNIPGNTDIIQHNITGLLYDTPQDFIREAKLLTSSNHKYQLLKETALRHVTEVHSAEKEEDLYLNLIRSCVHDKLPVT
ncbi:hypothetical protein SNE40_006961 [Patella caerulea]|uniref:Glycosyl transferase family 1 domain-containing protein n=1 Tax=Patella caerulea TaxID=87958 RepID=A0AAN8JWY7_PATCE